MEKEKSQRKKERKPFDTRKKTQMQKETNADRKSLGRYRESGGCSISCLPKALTLNLLTQQTHYCFQLDFYKCFCFTFQTDCPPLKPSIFCKGMIVVILRKKKIYGVISAFLFLLSIGFPQATPTLGFANFHETCSFGSVS